MNSSDVETENKIRMIENRALHLRQLLGVDDIKNHQDGVVSREMSTPSMPYAETSALETVSVSAAVHTVNKPSVVGYFHRCADGAACRKCTHFVQLCKASHLESNTQCRIWRKASKPISSPIRRCSVMPPSSNSYPQSEIGPWHPRQSSCMTRKSNA